MVKLGEEVSVGRDPGDPKFGGPKASVFLVKREVVTRIKVTTGFWESKVRLSGSISWDACFWGLEEEVKQNQCGYAH